MVFYLHSNSLDNSEYKELKAWTLFGKMGFSHRESVKTNYFTLNYAFGNVSPIIYQDKNTTFIIFGTFTNRGKFSPPQLSQLAKTLLNGEPISFEGLYGNYSFVFINKEKVIISNDYLGLCKIYSTNNNTLFSNSFLLVNEIVESKSINKNAFYEYIFTGAYYGTKTVINEISCLDPKNYYVLTKDSIIERPKIYPPPTGSSVSEISTTLKSYVQTNREFFTSQNISLGLSGGYDSRLLLATFLSEGIVPSLFTNGKPSSKDVIYANKVAKGLGLEIETVDKSQFSPLNTNDYLNAVRAKYYAVDGLSNIGIFNDVFLPQPANFNSIKLNGGGGEIFRNFWKLPPYSHSIKTLITSKYKLRDQNWTTSEFRYSEFVEGFKEVIKNDLNVTGNILNRKQIDMTYVFLRLRYWMSINNSINAQRFHSVTPFAEPSIFFPSFNIPIKEKLFGNFEASLINTIHPRIASFKSIYGYSFSEKRKPQSYLSDIVKIATPPLVRKYFREIVRKDKRDWGQFLSLRFVQELFNKSSEKFEVSRFVQLERIEDSTVFSRAISVEALLQIPF